MGRILAIDYGRKRTGLAVTDTLQIIANGLGTVPGNEVTSFLKTYVSQENIDLFVIGHPKRMNNEPSENMQHVKAFADSLHKAFPEIPIEYMDERFTSVMAHQAMRDGGLRKKRRQDKALADEIAATIILQGYLEKKRNEKNNNS